MCRAVDFDRSDNGRRRKRGNGMSELTTDSTTDAPTSTPAASDAARAPHGPGHHALGCPECFEELQRNRDWWKARPEGARLVGLVVSRDDMPSAVEQYRPGSLRRRDPRLQAPRSG